MAIVMSLVDATLTSLPASRAVLAIRRTTRATASDGPGGTPTVRLLSEAAFYGQLLVKLSSIAGRCCLVDSEARVGMNRLGLLWWPQSTGTVPVAVELSSHCPPGRPGGHGPTTVAGRVWKLARTSLPGLDEGARAGTPVFVHLGVEELDPDGALYAVMSCSTVAAGGDKCHRVFLQLSPSSDRVLGAWWWRAGKSDGEKVYPSRHFPERDIVCTVTSG
jgi:hypothetical protein